MTRITWNSSGERYYEAGVDRGVLYVEGSTSGVPWNGLISVQEKLTGITSTPFYVDGRKYLNDQTIGEFEATIEAYYSPKEFDECDGTYLVANGLSATLQKSKNFNLTYRTKIGNDIDGVDYGYKIHLIYNAVAKPSNRNNTTISDEITPLSLSWDITTRSVFASGFVPTSHFIIDSNLVSEYLLNYIENVLYGNAVNEPRFPDVDDLVSIFTIHGGKLIIVDNGDGTWTATGPNEIFNFISATEFSITSPSAIIIDQDTFTISSEI